VLPFSQLGAVVTAVVGLFGLAALSLAPPFRSAIDRRSSLADATDQRTHLLSALDSPSRQRYLHLEQRCGRMADLAGQGADDLLRSDALRKLCWLHLHLLAGRQRVTSVLAEVDLGAQPELQARSRERLSGIEAQLGRVEQQVDRLQVEGVLRDDPSGLASRINAVVWTLDDTGAWLRQQDLISESAAVPELTGRASKERG
jgi:hypothetical protein